MQVIPCIDIRAGKCVRLLQGQVDQQTVYGDDPVAIARCWAEAGAPLLHIVDLDGAFAGQMHNFGVIQTIVRAIPIPVQLGGGLRDLDAISRALDAGVHRVVLGTSALEQWDTLVAATARFPGQVCVGIDSRNGHVATRGWQTVSQVETIAFAQRVARLGSQRLSIRTLRVMACCKGRTSLVLQHWRSRCMCRLLPRVVSRN